MSLKLDFGSVLAVEVAAEGDLNKFLNPGITSLITIGPKIQGLLDGPLTNVPEGSFSTDFRFNSPSSWTITQAVGITLSVRPETSCMLTIVKPGDELFTYMIGEDGKEIPVTGGPNQYYLGIELKCSLAVDAGASFSSGNFGVSGDISNGTEFRVANYFAVANPSLPLRDIITQAFSHFILPFHAASIQGLPTGNYVDFEFDGRLALGFGATYGVSAMFLAGRSNGEVGKSFATPVGDVVVKAAPSVQVAAEFKVQYAHTDSFRVVAGRTPAGATLYLMRKNSNGVTTSEGVHLTLNAGATFQFDSAKLKAEAQTAVAKSLPPALAGKLPGVVDQAVGAVNNGINGLLAKGDGLTIGLELTQSKTHENTALFIYNFDFGQGVGAYDLAMRGDYAGALGKPGVSLDPRSFIEQAYISSAGLNLQFFDLLKFHDITTYIDRIAIFYLGNRTFQIRETEGVEAISGLFGRERQADLYFIAQCKNVVNTIDVSDVTVRLQAVFKDVKNADAFAESRSMMSALGLGAAADAIAAYVARKSDGTVQVTLEADAALLAAIQSDDYANNKPPKEPHKKDKVNYEQFVRAVADVIGTGGTIASTFVSRFGRYEDWLAFNRVVTDQEGSTNPGDRVHTGNPNGDRWPNGFPPADKPARFMVQSYILSGQAFMNFCDGVKHLTSSLSDVDTDAKFAQMVEAIKGMIHDQTPYPTYFLKPSLVALLALAGVQLAIDGALPDPNGAGDFSVSLKPAGVMVAQSNSPN